MNNQKKERLINGYEENEKVHIGIVGSAKDMFSYGLHFCYVLKKLQKNKRKVLLIDKYDVMRMMFYDNTLSIYTHADIDIVSRVDKVEHDGYDIIVEFIDVNEIEDFENVDELTRCTSLIYLATQEYKNVEGLKAFTNSNYDKLPNTYFVEYNIYDCKYSPQKLLPKIALDTESKVIEKYTIYFDEGNSTNFIDMQFNSKVSFKKLSKEYLNSIVEIVSSILATESITAKDIRKCFKGGV